MDTHVLSAYEQLRANNMAANQDYLNELGLEEVKIPRIKDKSTAAKRKIIEDPVRQSRRQQLARSQEELQFDRQKCLRCGKHFLFDGKNPQMVIGGHNSHCLERRHERSNSSEIKGGSVDPDNDGGGFDQSDASDNNQEQDESEEQYGAEELDPTTKPVLTFAIQYQKSLSAKYGKDEENAFRTRSKPGFTKTKTWEQYVLIYHHVVSKGLSLQDGQHMLDLFHNLFAVAGLTTPISLPTYVSIHAAMTKENEFGLEEFVQPFPVEYFGINSGLKPFKGVHFNIFKLIAEELYFADPAFF
jgi:hypothetical protein